MSALPKQPLVAGVNPYSPTAVALVSEAGPGTVTVATSALRKAFEYLAAYLAQPPPGAETGQGHLLTLFGEYGTGKSHLAAALLRRARRSDTTGVHTLYVEAPPSGTLVDLYKAFIGRFDRDDVIELLRDYYSDVVADELDQVPHTRATVADLRQGLIDPVDVVEDLQLPGSLLLPRLQERLIDVTGDENVSTALTLLLEPRTEALAWDWLAGNRPSEFLVDQGITRRIDWADAARSAIIAFLSLFGGRGYRLVVAMDELDRVLDPADQREPGTLNQFREMLVAVERSGTFLVVAGLTEIGPLLGADVLQRMGYAVEMPPMSPKEVRQLIQESHRVTRGGDDRLFPFTVEAVDYLTPLTNGVPRQLIKLCHHLYRRAQISQQPVDVDMVQQVARDHFDFASVSDVQREVPPILEREAIRFQSGRHRDAAGSPLFDYLVQSRDGEPRCAILISEGILSDADLQPLNTRVAFARSQGQDIEIVLVVVGYLAPDVASNVRDLIGAEPIEYVRRSFPTALVAKLLDVLRRFDELSDAEPVRVIGARVERLTRQQASSHALLEQLGQHVFAMSGATERQFATLRGELTALAVGAGQQPAKRLIGHPPGQAVTPHLAAVEELFAAATAAVSRLSDGLDRLLARAFAAAPDASTAVASARASVMSWLPQDSAFAPLGSAVFLRLLIDTFRQAVLQWIQPWSVGGGVDDRPSAADMERLQVLCLTYDTIFEFVSVQQLKRLAESTNRYPEEEWPSGGRSRPMHLGEIQEAFDGLGARVRDAVRRSFGES